MRKLKLSDACIQLLLILLTLISFLDTRYTWIAVACLFSWQVISIGLHRILRDRLYAYRFRPDFLTLVFLFTITSPIWLWFGFAIVFLWLPLSAWYVYINYREAAIIHHKQLVHLK